MFEGGRSKAGSWLYQVLSGLLLAMSCLQPASANGLLDSSLKNAKHHDFMTYFGFAENKTAARAGGLTDHMYYSKTWTCFLVLSVDRNDRVVYMKLGVPRPLIDDETVCTRGRDIVKSFVLASAIGQDLPTMKELSDEIYVRGLDLQPIKMNAKTPADSHKSAPQLQAYKIGKGPLTNGDNAIFLSEMPRLSPRASALFEAITGKRIKAGQVYQNCRIAFSNEDMQGSKSPMKLLWCDTWDEAYWKAQFAPVPKSTRK